MVTKITAIRPIDLNKRQQPRGNDYAKRKPGASFKDTLATAMNGSGKVNIKV